MILKLGDGAVVGMSDVVIFHARTSIFTPSCERREEDLNFSPCGRISSKVAQSRRVLLRYHMIAMSHFHRGLKFYCKYVNCRTA